MIRLAPKEIDVTKLLDKAIAQVRTLPDHDQDALAVILIAMAATDRPGEDLDQNTRAAVREGLAQARSGDFASEEEIAELWRRYEE
jgi:predicted transcriptional regulator